MYLPSKIPKKGTKNTPVIGIDPKSIKGYEDAQRSPPENAMILDTPEGKCWWAPVIMGERKYLLPLMRSIGQNEGRGLRGGRICCFQSDTDGMKTGYDNIFFNDLTQRVLSLLLLVVARGH